MLLLIIIIASVVVWFFANKNWDYDLAVGAIIVGFVSAVLSLVFLNSSCEHFDDAKNRQLKIASEWQSSAQTAKDWEWVCEQMNEANELAKYNRGNDVIYALFDMVYCFGGSKREPEMYMVTITEKEIIFPEKYDKLPLRKADNNEQ